jgi:hypothetical protein
MFDISKDKDLSEVRQDVTKMREEFFVYESRTQGDTRICRNLSFISRAGTSKLLPIGPYPLIDRSLQPSRHGVKMAMARPIVHGQRVSNGAIDFVGFGENAALPSILFPLIEIPEHMTCHILVIRSSVQKNEEEKETEIVHGLKMLANIRPAAFYAKDANERVLEAIQDKPSMEIQVLTFEGQYEARVSLDVSTMTKLNNLYKTFADGFVDESEFEALREKILLSLVEQNSSVK